MQHVVPASTTAAGASLEDSAKASFIEADESL